MRKKIGQIDIFASDEPNPPQSSFSVKAEHIKDVPVYRNLITTTPYDKNHFVIELNKAEDTKTLKHVYGEKVMDFNMADTLAHELGHVVAEISGDPNHASVFGNRLEREKLAWNLAERIKPDIDPEQKRLAIGTYAP